MNKIKLEANILKQNSIEEQLIFKASVEKYKDDNWEATNSLTKFELNQIRWVVVTNNDKEDKDIVQDEISENVIAINEFELKLDISKSNRCKYAHIFCYVDDYLLEGYSLVELKRDIKVDDIKLNYISNEEVELEAILNVDEATQEELEQIVWNINSKDILAYNGKTNIQHNIKEEKVYKTIFNEYIKDNQTIETSANTSAVFDENLKIIRNLTLEKKDNEDEDTYILKANSSNLENNHKLKIRLTIFDKNQKELAIKEDNSKVNNNKIEYIFKIKDLQKEFNLNANQINDIKGWIYEK